MTLELLLVLPALFALGLGEKRARALAPVGLVVMAAFQATLSIVIAVTRTTPAPLFDNFVRTDATARLFLVLINVIFLGIAGYVWSRARAVAELSDVVGRFTRLSLLFMLAANVVVLSNHLLASWCALEATSLAAAPLIVRQGAPATRLASWRYFLFSSVGLGLALLGFGCLMHGLKVEGHAPTYFLDELSRLTSGAPNVWRRLGLGLVFLGYGTKLGLAPMYTWLPETYDEAPPAVTALLAAVQFNCALIALIRVLQVHRAGNRELVVPELLVIGLVSLAVSTMSIIATRNFKRLLAYASINHAGVIAIGLGIGKGASYGVLLYVVSNAFIKAILFLTAGRIKTTYGTKDTRQIAGLIKDMPFNGFLLMIGTFALLGLPPFGSFLGELLVLSGLVRAKQIVVFVVFCTLITMTFVATGRTLFPMIWGEPKHRHALERENVLLAVPPLLFIAALVAMGVFMPPAVNALFRAVAASLGGE